MSEAVMESQAPSSEAIYDRARRRGRYLKELSRLYAARIKDLPRDEPSSLEEFRVGLVSVIVANFEFAGKCVMVPKTLHCVAGRTFGKDHIEYRVNRFPGEERERLFRKVLHWILVKAKSSA